MQRACNESPARGSDGAIGKVVSVTSEPLYFALTSPTEEKQAGHEEASMDALALVVSVTLLLLACILVVGRVVKLRRAAAARCRNRESVLQQAGLPLDAILLRGRRRYVQTAVVPTLVGLLLGGAVALGTYWAAYWYQDSQTLLLLLGVVLVVVGLRRRRSRPAFDDDETQSAE